METATAPSLRERNRLRTRTEILGIVLELVDEDGLAACTVEEIARRVGASKTTVYAHFGDGLDEMLRELYLSISQRVVAEASARRARVADPVDRIVALAEVLFEICAEPRVGRFYMMLSPAISPTLETVVGRATSAFRDFIRADIVTLGHEPAAAGRLALALTGSIRECAVAVACGSAEAPALLGVIRSIAAAVLAPGRPIA
ncbi:TetR/AcrR family transcriptional regulator [uncultured Amaricoccus sp.]|uniref:TetR/AcrR family transcriptional regulator n=1 Tax=uncultured Amaricoccus sp. TaxID=339341 RepID=UPI00260AFA56|nr:TetR/AcrR family transcriptional regulator [uncultured Amaricoccus sp.]